MRIYYLDPMRILQEYTYSERKVGTPEIYSGWRSPSHMSILGCLFEWWNSHLLSGQVPPFNPKRIWSELWSIEIGSGVTQEVRKPPHTDSWIKDVTLPGAVKSSKIAVICWINDGTQIHVYYDPYFCLEEYCYANGRWTRGRWRQIPPHR